MKKEDFKRTIEDLLGKLEKNFDPNIRSKVLKVMLEAADQYGGNFTLSYMLKYNDILKAKENVTLLILPKPQAQLYE